MPVIPVLSVGAIVDQVDHLLRPFSTIIPVLIRESVDDIGVVGLTINDDISGAVHGGRIYLFRKGMTSAEEVEKTLWHEMLHFGLRRFLTRDQYTSSLCDLYVRDAWIRKKADAWLRSPWSKNIVSDCDYLRARGVDEALADLSEIMHMNPSGFSNNTVLAKTKRVVSSWVAALADGLGFKAAAQMWRGYAAQKDARGMINLTFGRLKRGDSPDSFNSSWIHADPSFKFSESSVQSKVTNIQKRKIMVLPKKQHYFNDRSNGIFADGLFDCDGLPVGDTFACLLRIKMHGVQSRDWTKEQMKVFISGMTSAEMCVIMHEDSIQKLILDSASIATARSFGNDGIRHEMHRYAAQSIRGAIANGHSPDTVFNALFVGDAYRNLERLSGMRLDEDLIVLRAGKVRDHYDSNQDFASAISADFPDFEYPDWAHRTVGELMDSLPVAKYSILTSLGYQHESTVKDGDRKKGFRP